MTGTLPLDKVTAATFEPHVGSAFRLLAEDGESPFTTLALQEVTLLKQFPGAPKAPFSLIFEAPAEPALGQQTYWLRHDSLGDLAIFIVPVSGDSQTRRYQAIFS